VGSAGEDTAARWYRDHGFEVVDRNWRCGQGELDLVARRDRLLVFCEVKARNSFRYGAPFEAVTRSKQSRLRRLAAAWLRARGPALSSRPSEVRFDVASVSGPRLEVLEGAF
jgi:putative endonuclease